MDFVRLGPVYSTTYIPDVLIEGYNSLIWTERFQDFGEFELKSFDISGLTALLPVDTLVSHLETREVMQVETHEIEMEGEGADAIPVLTIRGRTAASILEHRWVESSYQKKRRLRKKYSATSALCVLLYNAVDNNSGYDVTRGDDDPDTAVINSYSWTTLDDIPNVQVTEAVAVEGETRWWQLSEGVLWPQMQNIMIPQDLGIRLLRPVTPNPGKVITVSSTLATRGTIVRTDTADISGLRFEVYAGIDRSEGSAAVQLSQLQGHLDKPVYLTSNRDYKTVVEVMSGAVVVGDVYRPTESTLAGWRRRTMGFDGGTAELPDEPEKPDDLGRNPTATQKENYYDAMDAWRVKMGKWRNKRDAVIADFREEQAKAALTELKKQRKMDMFAGDVSEVSPYKYKIHYNLGDTIMLYGDYGKTAKMVVQEYVRTEDSNGDRGFPGLVAP